MKVTLESRRHAVVSEKGLVTVTVTDIAVRVNASWRRAVSMNVKGCPSAQPRGWHLCAIITRLGCQGRRSDHKGWSWCAILLVLLIDFRGSIRHIDVKIICGEASCHPSECRPYIFFIHRETSPELCINTFIELTWCMFKYKFINF